MKAFRTDQIDPLGSREFNIRTGRIKQGVAEKDLARSPGDAEEDLLGSPPLMCRDHPGHARDPADGLLKTKETGTAGIGFIADHDARPLGTAHGTGTAICQQIDDHIPGRDEEWIVACGLKDPGTLLRGREMYGFDGFDPERFDDGSHQ